MGKEVSKNIAIFGVRGSGKTTYLTTIFYKFYHEQAGKEIEVDIEDERVVKFFREYLSRIRQAMKEGVSKPDEVLPPTLERREISFKVREEGKNWFNFRVVDYRGEDVEELSPDILDVFKKSDQIVAVIDAYRYADEDDYREMVNDTFIRLLKKAGKKGDFPLTILLTKYDLVESEYPDFGEYKEEFLKDLEETLENEGYTNVVFMPISCFRVKDGKLTLEDMNVEDSLLTVLRRWRGEMVPIGEEVGVEEEKEEEGEERGEVKRKINLKKLIYIAGGVGVIALLFFIFFTGGNNPPSPEVPKKVEKKISFSLKDYDNLREELDRILEYGGTREEMRILISEANKLMSNLPSEKKGEIRGKLRKVKDLKKRLDKIKDKYDSLLKEYKDVKQGKIRLYDLGRLIKKMSDFLSMDVSDIPRKCGVGKWMEEVRKARDELKIWSEYIKKAESLIKDFDRAFDAGNISEMKKIYARADELVESFPSALKVYKLKLSRKVLARYNVIAKALRDWKGKFAQLRKKYEDISGGKVEELSEDDLKELLRKASELKNKLSENSDLMKFLGSEKDEVNQIEKEVEKGVSAISKYNQLLSEWEALREEISLDKAEKLEGKLKELKNSLPKLLQCYRDRIEEMLKVCKNVREGFNLVREKYREIYDYYNRLLKRRSTRDDVDNLLEKVKKLKSELKKKKDSLPSAFYDLISNNLGELEEFLEGVLDGKTYTITMVEYEFNSQVNYYYKEIGDGPPDIYFGSATYRMKGIMDSYEGTLYVNYSFYWEVGDEGRLSFYDSDLSDDDYVGSVFIRSLEDMVRLAKGDQMDIICQGTKVGRAAFTVEGFRFPTLTSPDNL